MEKIFIRSQPLTAVSASRAATLSRNSLAARSLLMVFLYDSLVKAGAFSLRPTLMVTLAGLELVLGFLPWSVAVTVKG